MGSGLGPRYDRIVERRARRYVVWLPVEVEELEAGSAVGHDASDRGMLLVTAQRLEVGAPVNIVVRLPPDGVVEKRVQGKVVRVEANTDDPDSIWPHRLAVEFDQPVPEIERALVALAEQGIAKRQR